MVQKQIFRINSFVGVTTGIVLVQTGTCTGFSFKKNGRISLLFLLCFFLSKHIHTVLFLAASFFLSACWALVSLGFLGLCCFGASFFSSTTHFLHKKILLPFLILTFTYMILIINYKQIMFFNDKTRLCSSTGNSTGTGTITFVSVKLWPWNTYIFWMYILNVSLSSSRVPVFFYYT